MFPKSGFHQQNVIAGKEVSAGGRLGKFLKILASKGRALGGGWCGGD